jgi:group I intron endonuclease
MEVISGIYKIQSIKYPNRCYIGSAVDISSRWRCHLSELRLIKHGNGRLQNHCNKYGVVDLQFSILTGCDKIDLLKYEQFYIDFYSPYFNICKIAGNTLGRKLSDEARCKIGLRSKGNKYRLGKIPSTETRLKMSIARKGKPRSEEVKRKISKSHFGIKQTIESRQKLRISHLGIKFSDERKNIMSNAHIGKTHTEESKEKMRKSWAEKKKLTA